MVIDVEGNQHVGYSYTLCQANNIVDAFEGDVPSVLQILDERYPSGRPMVRGEGDGMGEPIAAPNGMLFISFMQEVL